MKNLNTKDEDNFSVKSHNYVTTDNDLFSIEDSDDNYKPDKIVEHVTIDNLQQQRIDELQNVSTNQPKNDINNRVLY